MVSSQYAASKIFGSHILQPIQNIFHLTIRVASQFEGLWLGICSFQLYFHLLPIGVFEILMQFGVQMW